LDSAWDSLKEKLEWRRPGTSDFGPRQNRRGAETPSALAYGVQEENGDSTDLAPSADTSSNGHLRTILHNINSPLFLSVDSELSGERADCELPRADCDIGAFEIIHASIQPDSLRGANLLRVVSRLDYQLLSDTPLHRTWKSELRTPNLGLNTFGCCPNLEGVGAARIDRRPGLQSLCENPVLTHVAPAFRRASA
jgi:hypothetical protein